MKPASVGPLVSSTYGKIIDRNGKSLGPHEPGELVIKGPQVMMGYLDDPDKTAECLSPGGWLRTGDVAYVDEDGYFFITDRIKELIKVRGYQVAPAELEALLLTNDLVADAAVIQIEDEASGELPRAYIVLKNGDCDEEATKTEIYEWVKERVAPYKRLDGGIVFKDTIPKSASGKILRRIIRDELKQESQ
jgi:4-coumarate--CoA ligase